MELLESMLIKYDFQKRRLIHSNLFQEIEAKIGFKLPIDYKFYCENYEDFEGDVGIEYFSLWRVTELINFNQEYGIFENLPNTIAIGSNQSSEFIGIEFIDNLYRIVLSPFIDLDKEYHITIGGSFTDFIQRLDKGIEWFS